LNTRSRITPSFTSRGVLAADAPLTVPMFLRLSCFQLSGIIILVFSKQKGLTLVFRNDPVDSVKVSSTFDSIPAIQRFLQAEIERLLRDLMREEVPAIIHKLSLEWAMRNQADECLSPASLTNTQPDSTLPATNYLYSLDADPNDPLKPVFSSINLDRLSALSLAQHTLSPFTPSIPQSVFRASTSLIASLRQSTMRRREYPTIKKVHQQILLDANPRPLETTSNQSLIKGPESEPPYYQSQEASPPESVHSTQSVDSSLRPSLYSRHQRSSYIRRPHAPKRKIVRLIPSRSESTGDVESSANSTNSEHEDYFSEPGGYRNAVQYDPRANWNGKDFEAHTWGSHSLHHPWNGVSRVGEKSGNDAWARDGVIGLPPLKETAAR
jgi:hypothetical protein